MEQVNTTRRFYDQLSMMSNRFNQDLFDGALPAPLFTLRRGGQSLAHCLYANWQGNAGDAIAEISLNPGLFAQHSWLTLMRSIAEQLCHLWQHCHGTPSRPGYHNKEWSNKLETIGLMPSSTGEPGGRRTGQIMASYPIEGGRFIRTCSDLAVRDLRLSLTARWSERPPTSMAVVSLGLPRSVANRLLSPVGAWSDVDDAEMALEMRERKRKLKYICPRCGVSAWGKSGLHLACRSCEMSMRELRRDIAAESTACSPSPYTPTPCGE